MNEPKDLQNTALTVTRWVGSPMSVVIHTIVFAASFLGVVTHVINFDRMLLILTTVVSLEAIYLAIFIQMTLNNQSQSIAEVSEDVEEIQEDVDYIQQDVEELQEDVEVMTEEAPEEEDEQQKALNSISNDLQRLIADVDRLKNTRP